MKTKLLPWRLVLLLFAILTFTPAQSAPVDADKAKAFAESFVSGGKMFSSNSSVPLSLAYTMQGENGNNMLYAFNRGSNDGYIIVSGDDEATHILGFGKSGHFDPDKMPDNMRAWFGFYARQIAWAQANGYEKTRKMTATTKADVAPMVQAHWNQSGNYANKCIFNGTKCVTGCVATAMAQVMHYWATIGQNNKVYRHGCTALDAYTTDWYGYNVPALPAIDAFAWDDMTTGYPSSTAAANAVSTLMRYCGQSVEMDYSPYGSGAYDSWPKYAFVDNFGYQESCVCLRRSSMTAQQWADKVYEELAAGRPMLMGGSDSNSGSGHEFVCDGYDASTDTYHINWGWGGYLDDWFSLEALVPQEGENFNDFRSIIAGIQPYPGDMIDINGGEPVTSAYAWVSSDGKKLTFCYDKLKSSRAGTTYYLNSGTNAPGWYVKRTGITSVVFNSAFSSARPTTCYRWFYGMTKLTSITGLANLNTSKVTNMASMFNGCSVLTSIDVSTFNTALVTTMNYMFYNCPKLSTIKVGSLSTAKTPTMKYMFASCPALTSLDLSNITFKSSQTTDYMMKDCSGLTTLSIPSTANYLKSTACTNVGTKTAPCTLNYPSGFTPSKTSTGSGWFVWKSGYFKDSSSSAYAWLSSDGKKLTFCYDTQRAGRAGTTYALNTGTNAPGWYSKRAGITSVVFNSAFSSARPTTCYRWFYGMTNLATITNLKYLNTSKATNMASMFNGCSKLTSLDVSTFNTALVTTMNYMFYNCPKLTSLTVGSLSTAKTPTMKYTFASCSALTSLDISNITFKSSQSTDYMMKDCSALKTLTIPSTASYLKTTACTNVGTKTAPCKLSYPSGFTPVKDATGSGWYQWKSGYFEEEAPGAYAWLSSDSKKLTFCYDNLRTSRAGTTYELNTGTNSPGWYSKRASITSVVFNSAFSSARPTTCYRWFYGMTNLATITNIKYLNTSKATNMASMFNGCSSLTSLDVSTFNTALVTTMNYMFYKCSKLTKLTVGSLSTAKTPTMKYTFASCSALTALDLLKISFKSTQDTEYMLKDCSSLKTLYVPLTAKYFNANVCTNVGTEAAPCTLIYPSGFTLEKDSEGSGWYKWKTGYFKNGPTAAYAWLSSDGKKLTFCYDIYKVTRAGTTYALNTGTNAPGWYDNREGITSVVFYSAFSSARPTTCYRWFYGMTNLATITNIKYLNTSKVTNMASMFNGCSSLTSLSVSTFNTALVTTMNYMFYKCSKLTSLTVGSLSTAKTPTMEYTFASCSALTSLDLSNITFKSSQDTEYMIKDCSGLKTLKIPSTAKYLNANACTNVGTKSAPCALSYPSGFTPVKDATGSGWYQWKSGYFKNATNNANGDSNGEGEVTVSDVQIAMEYVLGKNPSGFVFDNAEVTGDGEVSINDVYAISDMVLNNPASIDTRAYESLADMVALTAKGDRCTVHLSAGTPYHAFQMTVVLPEGSRMGNVMLADGCANGHQVKCNEVAPGRYNVVCWSSNGEALHEGSTALFHFNISGCDADDVSIEGVQMVNSWCDTVLLPSTNGQATGITWIVDDNSDGSASPYYNTVGIGSNKPQRGINIKDGRKVVVK